MRRSRQVAPLKDKLFVVILSLCETHNWVMYNDPAIRVQQLMVTHMGSPAVPISPLPPLPPPLLVIALFAVAACKVSYRWTRPLVAGRRGAHAAGGFKSLNRGGAVQYQGALRREKFILNCLTRLKGGRNSRNGSPSTAVAPPAPGRAHRRAIHRHMETFRR